LFEIEGGVLFKQINQVEFKNKIDEMLARDKLEQILPSAGTLIVNDGIFDQFNITKPKNGFGSVGFDPYDSDEDEEDGPDKTATKKKSKIANMKRQAQQNLEPNTRHAIERFVNIIPMMAALKAIDDRLTEE